MASPGGQEIGRLSLRIVGDASGLRRDIRAKIKASGAENEEIEVDVTADTAKATAEMEAWEKRQDAREIDIEVDVDSGGVEAEFRALITRLRAAASKSLDIDLDLDVSGLEAELSRVRKRQSEIWADTMYGKEFQEKARNAVAAVDAELLKRKHTFALEFEMDALDQAAVHASAALDRLDSILRADLGRDGRVTDIFRDFRKSVAESIGGTFKVVGMALGYGGLAAGLQMLTGYMGGLTIQAVGLAGALSQSVGVLAVAPALFTGAAAAVGVLATAFNGMGEALSAAASGDVEAMTTAMEDLTPAAQGVVTAFAGIMPSLTEIRKVVQEGVFSNLAGSVGNLEKFLVGAKDSLGAMATGINSVFSAIGSSLALDEVQAGFNKTTEAFGSMMTRIATGIPAFTAGFMTLSAAGSQFGDRMGNYVAGQMKEFYSWVSRITTDGSLERWVNGGVSAFTGLWNAVKDVSAALSDVFRISGGGTLRTIQDAAFAFREFTESARGVETISQAFANASAVIGNFHDVLKPLGGVFLELLAGARSFTEGFEAGFVPAMANSREAASGFANTVASLGEDLGGGFGQAIVSIGEVVTSLAPQLKSLAEQFQPLIEALATFAQGAGGAFLSVLTEIITVVNNLANALPGLTAALGAVWAVFKMGSAIGLGKVLKEGAAGFLGIETAASRAAQPVTGFSKAVSGLSQGLFVVTGAVAAFESVRAVFNAVNPAVAEFAAMQQALPQQVTSAVSAMQTGYQSVETTLNQVSQAYVDLEAKQREASKQMGEGFLNNVVEGVVPGYAALVAGSQKAAQEMGSLGEIFAKTSVQMAYENLPAVEKAQGKVAEAQKAFNDALNEYGANTPQAEAAALALAAAQEVLQEATEEANKAQKTAAELALEQAGAQASLVGLEAQAAQARLDLASATDNYNQVLGQYGESSDYTKVALGNLQAAMMASAQAAGDVAAAQAIATGASDGVAESYNAQRAVLADLVATQTGPAQAAAQAMLNSLELNRAKTMLNSEAFGQLKDSIVAVPDAKTIILSDNSPQTRAKMIELGYVVETLPDGNIAIYAKDNATGVAQAIKNNINSMSATIKVGVSYAFGPAFGVAGLLASAIGYATGGYVSGPGGPTDDMVPALLSDGEYVMKASVVDALGKEFFDQLNQTGTVNTNGMFADGGSTDAWFEKASRAMRGTGHDVSSDSTVVAGGTTVNQYITSATVESDSELVNRAMKMARMGL